MHMHMHVWLCAHAIVWGSHRAPRTGPAGVSTSRPVCSRVVCVPSTCSRARHLTRMALRPFLLLVAAGFAASQTEDEFFRVRFDVETKKGAESFVVKVHPYWAPIGAARFKELVLAKFYDDTRFYKVVKEHYAQFGLNGDVWTNSIWSKKPLKDERTRRRSNLPGMVTFANSGKNTRTTQLFINFKNNAGLDSTAFAPFGEVEGDGMEVVQNLYKCGEKPDVEKVQAKGNRYLDEKFPKLSKIIKAVVIEESGKKEL